MCGRPSFAVQGNQLSVLATAIYRQRFHFSERWGTFSLLPSRGSFYLNCTMVAWIGRGGMIAWPPRSPDLTHLDISVWGYGKHKIFVPPLPASLGELRAQIIEAAATIDAYMIHRIWYEIVYRRDICRMTRRNHIEHL